MNLSSVYFFLIAKYESHLLYEIEKAQKELEKLNSVFAQPCQKLAKVVRNPWEDSTLERLLSSKNTCIGPEGKSIHHVFF